MTEDNYNISCEDIKDLAFEDGLIGTLYVVLPDCLASWATIADREDLIWLHSAIRSRLRSFDDLLKDPLCSWITYRIVRQWRSDNTTAATKLEIIRSELESTLHWLEQEHTAPLEVNVSHINTRPFRRHPLPTPTLTVILENDSE